MDDSLLQEFHSVFSVSGDVNAPHRPHPNFSSLYKQKRTGYGEQDARRRRMLEDQKTRRRDFADYVRKIVDGEEINEEEEEMCDEIDSGGNTESAAAASAQDQKQSKESKKISPYRNQLMYSEWLVDIPEDFEENWLMTVCPIGKRSFVIAAKGTTKAYSRSGAFLNTFPSLLPGGCKQYNQTGWNNNCILDCIYHEASRTYYVLDIMCWKGHPVYDTDREFRHYWLRTKLAETAGIDKHSKINPYCFLPLDSCDCSTHTLTDTFSRSWPLVIDGLLFFHKHCHYVTGRTPLVNWLKVHMVQDVLKIPVSESFLSCAPSMSDPLGGPKEKGKGPRKSGDKAGTKMECESNNLPKES